MWPIFLRHSLFCAQQYQLAPSISLAATESGRWELRLIMNTTTNAYGHPITVQSDVSLDSFPGSHSGNKDGHHCRKHEAPQHAENGSCFSNPENALSRYNQRWWAAPAACHGLVLNSFLCELSGAVLKLLVRATQISLSPSWSDECCCLSLQFVGAWLDGFLASPLWGRSSDVAGSCLGSQAPQDILGRVRVNDSRVWWWFSMLPIPLLTGGGLRRKQNAFHLGKLGAQGVQNRKCLATAAFSDSLLGCRFQEHTKMAELHGCDELQVGFESNLISIVVVVEVIPCAPTHRLFFGTVGYVVCSRCGNWASSFSDEIERKKHSAYVVFLGSGDVHTYPHKIWWESISNCFWPLLCGMLLTMAK